MPDYYDSDCSSGEPYFVLKEEVRRGNYTAVLEALDAGKDPNERDSEIGDYNLLHWAAGMTDEETGTKLELTASPWSQGHDAER